MSKIESYAPGSFCWAELHTTDVEAAKKFYGEMFGWTPQDEVMPQGVYTMLLSDEGNTAGAMVQAMPGAPPHWNLYFLVTSADETAAKARELGGKVLMGPFDAHEAGRMAVIQDPQGTVFSIWQAKQHSGASHGGPLNMPTWPELHVPDAAAAVAFYSGLFGWKTKPESGFETAEYVEWINGTEHIAGMMPMRGEEWQGIPPHWMIYITVADTDERASKVKELGGDVCVPPCDIPGVGRFAVVNDPQKATFSIIRLDAAQASA